jgi:hypothetical protein
LTRRRRRRRRRRAVLLLLLPRERGFAHNASKPTKSLLQAPRDVVLSLRRMRPA